MTPRLTTSTKGRQLIKAFEGFRQTAAALDQGGWVLGYGHVKSARKGAQVTRDDAEKLLIYDLQALEEALNDQIYAPLTQNEFDALVSLAFNIGLTRFLRCDTVLFLNEGRPIDAAEAFDDWRMTEIEGRTVVVDALARRRAAEKALFLTPQEGHVAAPTPQVRVTRALTTRSPQDAVSVNVDLKSGSSAPEYAPLTPLMAADHAGGDAISEEIEPEGSKDMPALDVHVGEFADMPAPADASPEPGDDETESDSEDTLAMPEPYRRENNPADAEPGDKPAGPEPVEDVIARIARGMDEEAEEDVSGFDDEGGDEYEDDEDDQDGRGGDRTAKAAALSGDNATAAGAGPVTISAPSEPPSEEELWITDEKSEIERWRDLAAATDPDEEGSSVLWYALFLLIGAGLTGFGLFDSYQRWNGGHETAFYGPLIAAVGAVIMIGSIWFLVRQIVRGGR